MQQPWITSRLTAVAAIVAVAIIQANERTQAQTRRDPVIRLSQTVGPPTTPLTVEGTGFGRERIVLFFDADRVAAVFTETGRFTARIDVPRSAPPGRSTIRAVGQTTNAAAQTSFKVQTDWLQLGFNSRHVGLNPFENVIGPQNANTLTTAWVVPAAPKTFLTSSPAVVDDVLYSTWWVSGSGFSSVGAFDVQTGAVVWEKALFDALTLPSSPAVANGLVYVSTKVSSLYALDPKTGITQWQAITSFDTSNVGSPVTDGARVYQATGDCFSEKTHAEVQARDAVTGAFLWSQSIGVCAVDSPTVAGGMLYIMGTYPQSIGRQLYAFVAATGAPSWAVVLEPLVFGSPVFAAGRLYVNGYQTLRAFDASNGNTLWTTTLNSPTSPDPAGEGSPAVAYGKVYLGSATGRLHAIDAASGQPLWSAQVPFSTGSIDAAAAVANQVVYVQAFAGGGQFDIVAGFDADTGASVFLAATDDNTVISNAPHPSVVVVNGRVFVGSEDGRIFAFKLP
jgi:outer membrane protein assembly factor BamB